MRKAAWTNPHLDWAPTEAEFGRTRVSLGHAAAMSGRCVAREGIVVFR